LEPNRFPKNVPIPLELDAAEATRTCTGFGSGEAKAKTLALVLCGKESAGGWTRAGIVPEAVGMTAPGPPWALSADRKTGFMPPSPPFVAEAAGVPRLMSWAVSIS
jgi:hypothetical protein